MNHEELKAEIDAELAKMEADEKPETKTEVHSEASVDEATSELTSEAVKEEDPFLKEALEMGYDPKYSGGNKKSPEQFVKDGSFFKKIDSQKKELQELKKMMQEQIDHTKKVERAASEKLLKEAQAEQERAVEIADVEAYKQAKAKEIAANEQLKTTQPVIPVEAGIPEEVQAWAKKNQDWFNQSTPENKRMAMAADGLDKLLTDEDLEKGITRSITEHLERVEEKVRALFPQRFENQNTKKPSMVAKSTASSGIKTNDLASKLSTRQRQFVESARREGLNITAEEYAKQLKLTGELRDD